MKVLLIDESQNLMYYSVNLYSDTLAAFTQLI